MKATLLFLGILMAPTVFSQTSDNPYDKEFELKDGMQRIMYQGKYGYLDDKRREVIAPRYADANDFYDGMAKVSLDGKKYGYINTSGNLLIPMEYESLGYGFKDGLTPAKKDGKWGMISDKGRIVIEHKYDNIGYFSEGLAMIAIRQDEKMKYGFVDMKGREVIAVKYKRAGSFYDGLAYVVEGDKYGYINTKGQVVIPFAYQEAYAFYDGLAAVKVNGKWGFINNKNKMVIPARYDKAYSFENGEAQVMTGNDAFHINKQGQRLNPGKWLMVFTKGLALGDQFWFRKEKFDNTVLGNKYKEGYRYTDIVYNQHKKEVFLVMSKVYNSGQTGPKYNYEFDAIWKKIKEYYKDRWSVNYLAHDNGKWTMIISKMAPSKAESAVSNKTFPAKSIEEKWKQGKSITSMAYDGKKWLIIFRNENYTGQFIKYYDYDWDQEDVDKQMKNGYAVTQAVKAGSTWVVVFTKGTGIKEQVFLWSEELPLRDIKSYWDKGYKSYRTFYIPRNLYINKSFLDYDW